MVTLLVKVIFSLTIIHYLEASSSNVTLPTSTSSKSSALIKPTAVSSGVTRQTPTSSNQTLSITPTVSIFNGTSFTSINIHYSIFTSTVVPTSISSSNSTPTAKPESTSIGSSNSTPTAKPESTSISSSNSTPTAKPESTSISSSSSTPTVVLESTSISSSNPTPTVVPQSTSIRSNNSTPTAVPESTSVFSSTSSKFTPSTLARSSSISPSSSVFTSNVVSSSVMITTTPKTPVIPNAVRNLNVTFIYKTNISLSWLPSNNTNDTILYKVYLQPLTGPNKTKLFVRNVTVCNITITELEEFIRYRFTILPMTTEGFSGTEETIEAQTLPHVPSGVPQSINITETTSSTIYLTWLPPEFYLQNGKLRSYLITYKIHNNDISHSRSVPANQTFVLLQSLKSFRKYDISIQAVNHIGDGPAAMVNQTTHQDVPSRPSMVGVGNITHNSAVAFWMLPGEPNGVITGYNYWFNESEKFAVFDNSLSVELTSLTPYTYYKIYVSANTSIGEGNATMANFTTLEYAPSPPYNLTVTDYSHNYIVLQWEEPETLNGVLLGYRIHYCLTTDILCSLIQNLPSNTTTWNQTNIQPFKNYTFYVTAYTNGGSSQTNNITQQTTQYMPSAPLEFVVEEFDHDYVVLTWKPPNKINGILLGYKIKYCATDVCNNTNTPTTLPANITRKNFTNLTPYTTYNFIIYAYTEKYDGLTVNVTQTTDEHIPGTVRNITVVNVTATSVVLSWLPPVNKHGEVFYNISYKETEGPNIDVEIFYNTTEETRISVDSLEEYILYEFIVEPFTKNGGHGHSQSKLQRTRASKPTGAPENVTAISNSSTQVILMWNPPSFYERNGPILRYMISYIFNNKEIHANTTTGSTTHLVDGLNKYKFYTFGIQMVNSEGDGPKRYVNATTQQDVPGPVFNLSCVGLSNDSITLSWLEPRERNGIITNYHVTNLNTNTTEEYSSTFLKHTEDKLDPFRTYNFSLVASTTKGQGVEKYISCDTDESVPDPPFNVTIVTNAYWIFISWEHPRVVKGVITDYKITYKSETEYDIRTGGSVNTKNITEFIKPAMEYTISIAAATKKGFGAVSQSQTVTTKEAAPTVVQELRVIERSSTSLKVSWKPPSISNGIVFYRVYQRLSNETENSDKLIKGGLLDTQTSYVVAGLEEFTSYIISVQSYTQGGDAEKKTVSEKTLEAKPTGVVQNLTLKPTKSTAIELTWDPLKEVERNGIIDSYEIKFERITVATTGPGRTELTLYENKTVIEISSLSKYTMYTFSIRAHNSEGFGPTLSVNETTLEDTPGPPKIDSVTNDTVDAVVVIWKPPQHPNGIITGYNMRYRKTEDPQSTPWTPVENPKRYETKIKNLEPYTRYELSLSAITSIGEGDKVTKMFHTEPYKPGGPPTAFRVYNKTATYVVLHWKPPLKPNGRIVGYEIDYNGNGARKTEYVDNQEYSMISPLVPNTEYEFMIRCKNEIDHGDFSEGLKTTTHKSKPPQPTVTPPLTPNRITPNSITIPLWSASDKFGKVQYYHIIVFETNATTKLKPPDEYPTKDIVTYTEYRRQRVKGNIVPYIAAKILRDDLPKTFTVGIGNQRQRGFLRLRREANEEYLNGRLFPDIAYSVVQRAYVNEGKGTSQDVDVKNQNLYVSNNKWFGPYRTAAKPVPPPPTSNTGAIAGGVVAALVILLVIGAAVYYFYFRSDSHIKLRKSSRRDSDAPGEDNEGFQKEAVYHPAAHPVKIENFSAYVRNLSKDGKYLFSEEFKLIQSGRSGYSCMYEHSNHPINRDKNRYNNIVAYDHTRVLLEPTEGVPESDYINANFIDGYARQTSYIATQGPLENTCDDFWRMCWEQNVSSIVMLTGLEENTRIKCHQYWPDIGTLCYGKMQCTLITSSYLPTYVIRTFSLLHAEYPGEERFIKHFHLLAWRDHGTPNSQELLSFTRRVNQSNEGETGPVVVHCSAGVGRTGTYIVLDVNLRKIANEGSIEIYNYLQHIRSQRNYMVQTEAQYVFIHDTLIEYLTFGLTEVSIREIRDYVKRLQQPSEGGAAELNVDKEFHKLNLFDQSSSKTMNAANASCNKNKNRFLNVLPYDETRVTLRQLPGVHGSDYINANYIHGYSQSRQFIATQAPLPQTIPDFWRMIWEHHCMTIVCLAQETENGKEKGTSQDVDVKIQTKLDRYWPSIEAAMHGPLMIESVSEKDHRDFMEREFKVTHTTEGHSRNIKHYQYVNWPDNSYPDSARGLVDLIGLVQKWHQQNGSEQLVVHCSAGVGRTGVFIALSNMIERVRVEGVVDVFQAVRTLRTQRPAMVQTKAQYLFCYLALQEFLASFDIYQNFN